MYVQSAKQIQSFFDKSSLTLSRDARADANLLSQSALFNLRDALVFFLSSKNVFRSYLMIFKCVLAIRLRSITVEISYVSSTGEVVSRKGLVKKYGGGGGGGRGIWKWG